MNGKVNVSCVQTRPAPERPEENVAKMADFVETVMKERPETELIVFPEPATSGYECAEEAFRAMAERVSDGKRPPRDVDHAPPIRSASASANHACPSKVR